MANGEKASLWRCGGAACAAFPALGPVPAKLYTGLGAMATIVTVTSSHGVIISYEKKSSAIPFLIVTFLLKKCHYLVRCSFLGTATPH